MASTSELPGAAALLLLLLSVPAAHADADFISRTCDDIYHRDLCQSLLGGDPRSPGATTVLALASIGLDAATANARHSAWVILKLAEGKYAGTPEGEALAQCAQLYGGAVGELDRARQPLDSGAYSDASTHVYSALNVENTCQSAFDDRGVCSVVHDVDQRMGEQCIVAFELIELIVAPPPPGSS